jgi:glycosyltransferase involved in cell wall biosynthesis
MKVLFLCKRFYTSKDLIKDRFGRLFHLPVQFSRLGATVEVIALDYRNRHQVSQCVEGVNFRTGPAGPVHLPGLLLGLRRSALAMNPDVIIASGDSHIGFIGRHLAKAARARFVFDVYDYYPAFPGNRIPGMRSMFQSSVRNSDLTLCASMPLIKKLSELSRKLVLVENGVDRTLFVGTDKHLARDAVGVPRSAILAGYFGAITPKRGPLLIEAVRLLRARIPSLAVLMAGKLIQYKVADEFVHYKGELPQHELPMLISACDVVTVPYERDPQIDLAGPCKIAEYLACGRPVVATRVAGHERIFESAPSSLCEPNPEAVAEALEAQLQAPQLVPFPVHLDWSQVGLAAFRAIHNL